MSYVAFQYAEALFSLALEERQLPGVKDAYDGFLAVKDQEFTHFLNHPKVTRNEKKDVLKNVVNNTVFLHFLYVLIDNHRIDLIDDCHHEFVTILNNQNKEMDVTVFSKAKLTKEELQQLQTNIGKKHNRTDRLSNVVEPTILGGIRIEYEGHVLDQTINNYLHDLKNDLTR